MTETAADAAASTVSWVPAFLIESFAEKENAVRRWQDGI
jgi:hypothetical protein